MKETITYKFLDKEEYAKQFQRGKIKITSLLDFATSIDPTRRDPEEGHIWSAITIDPNQSFQTFNLFGKPEFGVCVEALKQDGYYREGMEIEAHGFTDACILSLTCFDADISKSELFNIIEKSLTKKDKEYDRGYFCVIKNMTKFEEKIKEKFPNYCIGKIHYGDKLKNRHPFVKAEEYKNESELRILFPSENKTQIVDFGSMEDFIEIYKAENSHLTKI